MPNWTTNKVFFKTETKKELDEIIRDLAGTDHRGEDQQFTFNKFVPMPESIITTIPDPADNYGIAVMSDDEYEWCISAWGTKWDACDVELERTDETHLILSFNTAWCAPAPVADAMSKHFGATLVAWIFHDECDSSTPSGIEDALQAGFEYDDLEFAVSEHWRTL